MKPERKPVVPRLLLDTKIDIPFPAAQITIHQPSIAEIGLIGGDGQFFIGVNALTKNYKNFEDNSDLSEFSNFEIFMTMIMQNKNNKEVKKIQEAINGILFLIFPEHNCIFTPQSIMLQSKEDHQQVSIIDANNFDGFADILYDMFCMSITQGEQSDDYDPAGDRARAIVDKFRKRREYLEKLKQERGEDSSLASIFGRYISVLAVGEKKDKNVLSHYSVYQLVDEFKRFQLKETFDFTIKAQLAGATKIKDPQDWMGDIQLGDDQDEEK